MIDYTHYRILARIADLLTRMLKNPADQIKWLESPHPDFDGKTPKDFAAESMENARVLAEYLHRALSHGA